MRATLTRSLWAKSGQWRAFFWVTRSQRDVPIVPQQRRRPRWCNSLLISLIIFVLFCTSLEQVQPLFAAERAERCNFSAFLVRTATAVTGPRSLRLDDGTEVALEGLLPPSRLDHRSVPEDWALPEQAAEALAQAAVGRSVELSGRAKERDRYGRRVAQVHIQSGQGQLWLQDYLIQTGHARVAIRDIHEACQSRALLRGETIARDKRRGLWAGAGYAIRAADKPWELLRYRSTLQIVEGRVKAIARVRSKVFINFGREWKRDFTIGIRWSFAKKLRVAGLKIEQLKGRKVRVRGWIERRGGPYIQLRKREQISLVPNPKLAGSVQDNERGAPLPTYQGKEKRPAYNGPDVLDL